MTFFSFSREVKNFAYAIYKFYCNIGKKKASYIDLAY